MNELFRDEYSHEIDSANKKAQLKIACRLTMRLVNMNANAGRAAMESLGNDFGPAALAWFKFFEARDAVFSLDPNFNP